jgi:MbtH protein
MTDLPRGTDPEETMLFDVVVNHEEQYSLWLAGSPIPSGWKAVGVQGTKQECLEHIERVWTDMRPRSLRERRSRSC